MKFFFTAMFCLFQSLFSFGQNEIKKGDVAIHLEGADSWNEHRFVIDVFKTGSLAKIKYAYSDSSNYTAVRKDPDYQRIKKLSLSYNYEDPKRKPYNDTISMIIRKHRPYVKDSVIVNLKKDTAYANLTNRFAKATKEELQPKIERNWTDGYGVDISIKTVDRFIKAGADTPTPKNHSLLINFIRATLNKGKDKEPAQKTLMSYSEFR